MKDKFRAIGFEPTGLGVSEFSAFYGIRSEALGRVHERNRNPEVGAADRQGFAAAPASGQPARTSRGPASLQTDQKPPGAPRSPLPGSFMRLDFFAGLRPFSRAGAVRDAIAGVTLASMNIPQVLGYTRIAGTPVVTGLYTVLLPLVGFAVFGSSRHLVVAADSATAAIFSSSLSRWRRRRARSTWRWSEWSRC